MSDSDPTAEDAFDPGGSFTRVPGVAERLPAEYNHLETVVGATYVAWPHFVVPESRFEHLKLRFFDRAFNVVKGTMILIEQSHWELAAPLVRQLFEMILNMEELQRWEDADAAVDRFARFAVLQEMRHEFANLRHDIATGRDLDANELRLQQGEQMAEQLFPEFRIQTRRGGRWAETWCGATTKQLAERSPHPLRASQYEVVFRFLSAYGHGAPVVITGTLGAQVHADDVEWRVADDDKNTVEIIALTITFFAELWLFCRPVTPDLPLVVVEAMSELGGTMREANEAVRQDEGA